MLFYLFFFFFFKSKLFLKELDLPEYLIRAVLVLCGGKGGHRREVFFCSVQIQAKVTLSAGKA